MSAKVASAVQKTVSLSSRREDTKNERKKRIIARNYQCARVRLLYSVNIAAILLQKKIGFIIFVA